MSFKLDGLLFRFQALRFALDASGFAACRLYGLGFKLYCLRFKLQALRFALEAPGFTRKLQALRFTLEVSGLALGASGFASCT